jgi:flagellar hook-length control protein FliK
VALHHAIDTVRMTVELSARSGYSQARIQLAPPELGEIRINLHQTADGLIAKVTAADGAAAQTLQQGGAELRRSLESAGVTLLRLDIGSSSQQGPSAGQSGFGTGTPGGTSRGDGPTDDDPTTSATTLLDAGTTAVELPGGVTIDVFA